MSEGKGRDFVIAYRTDFDRFKPWYVSQLPARKGSKRALRDGVDWGYETDVAKALQLSRYWARRFAANARFCGHEARFLEAK